MSKAQELKPCPFCNGSRAYVSDSESTAIHIVCRDCGAQLWGCKRHFSDEASAIFAWNTRAPASSDQQAAQQDAPDLVPPMGIRNDRDMLKYLMGAFDSEVNYCVRCGCEEETKDMDSANLLREYLAAARASNGGKA